jgi:hypothetical protein
VAWSHPLWLTTSSLVSFVKVDTLRERETAEMLKYKGLALRYLKNNLQTSNGANDDILVMSMMAMLSFEVNIKIKQSS